MDISKSFLKKLLTSIVFIATFGFATTLHVATTGSDDNDGSEENPFATIQAKPLAHLSARNHVLILFSTAVVPANYSNGAANNGQ